MLLLLLSSWSRCWRDSMHTALPLLGPCPATLEARCVGSPYITLYAPLRTGIKLPTVSSHHMHLRCCLRRAHYKVIRELCDKKARDQSLSLSVIASAPSWNIDDSLIFTSEKGSAWTKEHRIRVGNFFFCLCFREKEVETFKSWQ